MLGECAQEDREKAFDGCHFAVKVVIDIEDNAAVVGTVANGMGGPLRAMAVDHQTDEVLQHIARKKTNEGNYHAIERNYYHSFADGTLQRDAYRLKREDVDSTSIDVYRWRIKKGDDRKKLKNDGVGFDMLSIFYELRNIDYSKLRPGQKLEYHITSGIKNRGLHVKYKGRETCTLKNGRKYPAYLVELTFSTKDSDSTPLQAWLSTDPDHRPLSVVINLKRIGAVQGEIVE